MGHAPLSVASELDGKHLVVLGGTGFLGKVWWSFVLSRFPNIGRLYLLMRPRDGVSAEERFENEIAPSLVFDPLRDAHGSRFMAFLRDKVHVVPGDLTQPLCGLEEDLRARLRGTVHGVVNVAGVVDFDPPLDEALEVNAFGVQNLVALAKDLGDVPLLHTSTCYVAGDRTGFIEEVDPREFPFPRAGDLDRSHWDPDREIAECLDVIRQARHRASDAFRQSRFLDEAKRILRERNEPETGAVLEEEVKRVRRRFVEARLAEMGMERAQFWGFPNTYTYTKSIGEQIAARSGLPFTIVRPAVVESTLTYPFPGWNEGINTSAPLIYVLRHGGLQVPGSDNYLDVIPCDLVAGGLTVALAELLEGTAKPVYQLGSSDTNPCTMRRFFELTGLYKRRYYRRTGKGGPIVSFLQLHWEGALLSADAFRSYGPGALARRAEQAAKWLGVAAKSRAAPLVEPAASAARAFADQQRKLDRLLGVFVPFTAEYDYIFRCDNTRAAVARLSAAEQDSIDFRPERIDWRHWFMDVHAPGLERWVFPKIDERTRRPKKPPRRHETLPALLFGMADRHDLAVALQRTEKEGLSRITYREWRERSLAAALRLKRAGVVSGDRVILAGQNHPDWAIAFFGILLAGATVVPVEVGVEPAILGNLVRASRARVLVLDADVSKRLTDAARGTAEVAEIAALAAPERTETDPEAQRARVEALPKAEPGDLAVLIYTSGTTGKPKGVMLTHSNLTALVASLAPVFPLSKGDRVLSVLPLHHTFELTCGLLLPLSRGARVVYLDELSGERVEHALKAGRITALVGVPAIWEMLERRIHARIAEHGELASRAFDLAVEVSRAVGQTLGLDAGRLLFGPVHEAMGGHLRYLVSGGAALPARTHQLFSGLGLHLAEGYGLSEASPVLTVAEAGPRTRSGHVGKPIPGVELRIGAPDRTGVGEVLARGPNVMLGYADDEAATREALDAEGWLRTGDLGRLDRRGRLQIVGRAKDTIVTSTGENIYPDDAEARLGTVDCVKELALVGVDDGKGGERLACVAVVENVDGEERRSRHERARQALQAAFATLPQGMRPAIVTLIDTDLPRTSTRKVKRGELRELVERTSLAERSTSAGPAGGSGVAIAAAAAIARKKPDELGRATTLRGDLGMDSLLMLEFLVALESRVGHALDAARLAECTTLGDVDDLLVSFKRAGTASPTARIQEPEVAKFELPAPLRRAAMNLMGGVQMSFYEHALETTVSGRAFIPQNKNTIVVANHASHLDMGLVKYALGPYGRDIASLAAQDYFFEEGTLRKAYFETFTNLVPMSRAGSLRQTLRQAGEVIGRGRTVLIFPEGTRSPDGAIHEFRPAVGHLALHYDVDILPIWLEGTFDALPKGVTVPRKRKVAAHIGLPLEVSELRRLTSGLTPTEASRTVAELAERAVRALSRGELLDLKKLVQQAERPSPSKAPKPPDNGLELVFRELENRFVAGVIDHPLSFYFSLGQSERWTIRVTRETCEVLPGKVADPADCVLKTSPAMFRRIVNEAYTPSPAEFLAGAVKSNNIPLLMTFQKLFRLEARGNAE